MSELERRPGAFKRAMMRKVPKVLSAIGADSEAKIERLREEKTRSAGNVLQIIQNTRDVAVGASQQRVMQGKQNVMQWKQR